MSSPRFGLGPVFAYEWLRISRRWQLYAVRSFFVGLLLLGLMFTWGTWGDRPDGMQTEELARLGQTIYSTIVTIELTLILLAAPAATAGAVCVDKARGSLLQVMATDLSDSELVLGKLAAALTPVIGLVCCTLPVLMLSSLLGGIDPMLLLGSFLTTLTTAVLVCTLAFTLSVWGKKAHEVLGATYMIVLAWLALIPFTVNMLMVMAGLGAVGFSRFGRLIQATNPYALLYPSFNGSMVDHLHRVLIYCGGGLGLSAAMIGLCIATIRRVTVRQRSEGGGGRTSRRTWRLPSILPTLSLDANPVLWREWTRNRPSRWGRFVSACYLGFALFLTGTTVIEILGNGGPAESGIMASVYTVGVGLLLMSVRSSTSLSEERIRGSLDLLTSTPLTTTEILAGKWWGTFRMVAPMALLTGLLAALACGPSGWWTGLLLYLGLILAYAGVTTSLGLAIAVWVPQQGRAVGLCVGLYVAACVGWPLLSLMMALSGGPGPNPAVFFLFGSPIGGTVMGLVSLAEHRPSLDLERLVLPTSMVIWTCILGAATLGLFRLACESFEGQLGRRAGWNEESGPWREFKALIPRFGRRPLEKPKPATAEME
ncbi:ABC transporter permease subunit [Paludisphaera rhizosphaerae]|uniref:ABC transporter permease subunit n=1 Tax=Paludisphaera rhizosphaerae TaxID=2711216 RepID=UPI0013E9F57B|nr:ABC transporter permease subunit [Paludisphaera rhizosphaerae]